MKIFLSCGSDFVGRHLLRHLRAEGHGLGALVRSPAGALKFAWYALRLEAEPPSVRETVRLLDYPFTVDISRAQRRLDDVPVVSIDQGLYQLAATKLEPRGFDLAGRAA